MHQGNYKMDIEKIIDLLLKCGFRESIYISSENFLENDVEIYLSDFSKSKLLLIDNKLRLNNEKIFTKILDFHGQCTSSTHFWHHQSFS